ncbi:MAG TPA: glycerol kinase GlpK [Kiritimatiellia bacterium]|nr:glycerol kinase GlpK [Kiritimatiellia bacterium]
MTNRVILSFDQGTTSSRSVLMDEAGKILGVTQKEFEQHYPKPGWVEHDPEEIWKTQLATARKLLSSSGTAPQAIAGIGVTNQRETTVLWNRKTGVPVAPAIVWQDRRTASQCNDLRENGLEDLFRRKTGLLLDPYFSGTKIKWLLDHVEGLRNLANAGELAFGTIDTWLVWKLTKGKYHITDHTNASRTLLYNIHDQAWDNELLQALDIPATILPEIVPSSGELAITDTEWFGRPVPITGIAGDQQAALFGQACTDSGMIKNTYGTGCFLLLHVGGKPVDSQNKLLATVAWQVKGDTCYALEGSVFTGGSVVQWLRDGLGIIKKSGDIEALANSVKDSNGVVMVPAFTGLGAPVWDAGARGLIIGLTRGVTAAHIARAALESIAFQVSDVVGAMKNDSRVELRELRVDGGAAVNDLLMQFQSNLLGIPVVRPVNTESTATGAAYLAGLGAGVWSAIDDLSRLWRADRTFEPQMSEDERANCLAIWQKARDRAVQWA